MELEPSTESKEQAEQAEQTELTEPIESIEQTPDQRCEEFLDCLKQNDCPFCDPTQDPDCKMCTLNQETDLWLWDVLDQNLCPKVFQRDYAQSPFLKAESFVVNSSDWPEGLELGAPGFSNYIFYSPQVNTCQSILPSACLKQSECELDETHFKSVTGAGKTQRFPRRGMCLLDKTYKAGLDYDTIKEINAALARNTEQQPPGVVYTDLKFGEEKGFMAQVDIDEYLRGKQQAERTASPDLSELPVELSPELSPAPSRAPSKVEEVPLATEVKKSSQFPSKSSGAVSSQPPRLPARRPSGIERLRGLFSRNPRGPVIPMLGLQELSSQFAEKLTKQKLLMDKINAKSKGGSMTREDWSALTKEEQALREWHKRVKDAVNYFGGEKTDPQIAKYVKQQKDLRKIMDRFAPKDAYKLREAIKPEVRQQDKRSSHTW